MAEKKLRSDQQDIIHKTYNALSNGESRVLVVMPTGSGKTFLAANQIKDAVASGHQVLFMVNRDALVTQAYKEFTGVGLDVGVWAGEYRNLIKSAPVQIASAQTLLSRSIDNFTPTLVYLDEAHLTAYSSASTKYFENPCLPIIGLTATPYRLASDEEMGDKFDCLVSGLLPYQMIEMGFLKKPVYYGLFEKYDHRHSSSLSFLVKEWKRLSNDRKTICFASGVDHARAIASTFTDAGVPFAAIDGSMSPIKRNKIYETLQHGELVGVASCDALSEGFDVPKISCVVLARDTESQAKYNQQVGRGLRKFAGITDCIVLDLSGITQKFGGVEEILEYSLSKSSGKSVGSIPKKVCPNCEAVIFAFLKECDRCKHRFPAKEMPQLSLEEQMLQLVVPKEKRFEVLAYRRERSNAFKRGASLFSVDKHFSNIAPQYAKGAIFGEKHSAVKNQAKFLQYLTKKAKEENHDQAWIQSEFFKEFGFATT